jgi:hypothetical protein
MKDPYVAEVRKYRMEHTRRFNADLHLICEDLRRFESSLGERVVTLKPEKARSPQKQSKPRPGQ